MLERLKQVAIFAKTVDHGSFRGAARELRLSPSVVSQHISQLEEHLGVALLYRSTRKLALTREGELLLASTHPMLTAVDDAFSKLSDSSNKPTGELRVTTPCVLIQSHLTDLLASFSMKYPSIKLIVNFSDTREDLITQGYDIAIRVGVQPKSTAASRNLFQLERCLVASKNYLKDRPKVLKPEQLVDWDWIELSPVRHVKPTFRKPNGTKVTIKPTAHLAVNDALALYRLSRSGAGLAVVPAFLADEDVNSGVMEHVLPKWKLDPLNVFAAWPANAPKHGLINLLINEISPAQFLKK